MFLPLSFTFFFFNDTATTEIYTLSLHDALPICHSFCCIQFSHRRSRSDQEPAETNWRSSSCETRSHPARPAKACPDRKSTRLNSSHLVISYAVFCLKKKKHTDTSTITESIKVSK